MAKRQIMRKLARWHIWLGWLVGVPLVMWTATGLVMVLKPIEEVRGNHLRKDVVERALPVDTTLPASFPADSPPVRTVQTQVERGQVVTLLTYMDGSSERLLPDGSPMPPVTEAEARQIVAEAIEGGDPEANPFLERQWVLASMDFLANDERRATQAIAAGQARGARAPTPTPKEQTVWQQVLT